MKDTVQESSAEESAKEPEKEPNNDLQTVGQLERTISQKVQALYKQHLGHQPSKVTCQLFDSKMAIVLENSITQPERLLIEEGKVEIAEKVRSDLNQAIKPQVKALIEDLLNVKVLDLLSDAAIDTARTGIIVVLSSTPSVRNPEALPKSKK